MEETLRTQLIDLASTYERLAGVTPSSSGKRALNDNTFFSRIAKGDGFNVKTFDRLVQWFSDQWPENAEWPADLPRPIAAEKAA